MSEPTGEIAELWRFPVKSMAGESLEQAELSERGVVGDRAYALVESESGKVVSAKSSRRFPNLLRCQAAFLKEPTLENPAPPVRISLPGASHVDTNDPEADKALSALFGTEVKVATEVAGDFVIDQVHPDVDGGSGESTTEQTLGFTLFQQLGMDSPVPVGAFFDLFPYTILTTSTLRALASQLPEAVIDSRRFRMNFVVETEGNGYLENDWIGRQVTLGDAAFGVALADPRCVITTLPQDGLERAPGVLRALARSNMLEIPGAGKRPCAGVYAVHVAGATTVRLGDPVAVG